MLLHTLNFHRIMHTYGLFTLTVIFLVVGTECKKKNKKTNFQDAASEVRINYFLFRRSNRSGIPLTREKLPQDFDHNLPSYVMLHGLGSSHNAVCQRNIRNALLDRRDVNVIVPSYQNSSLLYTVAYQEVARQVGSFLVKEGVSQSTTGVVGSSLGAQIAGVIRRRSGFRPRDIYGLDPAGPIFEGLSDNHRLSTSSAEYVQAIHTNAGVLGVLAPVGNDDLYINGGNDYPCCNSNVCRHSGACDFFVRTIRNGPMQARQCDALNQAKTSSCRGSTIDVGYGSSRQSGRRISHLQLRQCGNARSLPKTSSFTYGEENAKRTEKVLNEAVQQASAFRDGINNL